MPHYHYPLPATQMFGKLPLPTTQISNFVRIFKKWPKRLHLCQKPEEVGASFWPTTTTHYPLLTFWQITTTHYPNIDIFKKRLKRLHVCQKPEQVGASFWCATTTHYPPPKCLDLSSAWTSAGAQNLCKIMPKSLKINTK